MACLFLSFVTVVSIGQCVHALFMYFDVIFVIYRCMDLLMQVFMLPETRLSASQSHATKVNILSVTYLRLEVTNPGVTSEMVMPLATTSGHKWSVHKSWPSGVAGRVARLPTQATER